MIDYILHNIQEFNKNNIKQIKLEKRPAKYMFGTNNYGEILDTLNPNDGDPWDVIVPGYPSLQTDTVYHISTFEGVIIMPNGNHKLIVNIQSNFERASFYNIRNEIYTYRRLYNKLCKKYGHIVFFKKNYNSY